MVDNTEDKVIYATDHFKNKKAINHKAGCEDITRTLIKMGQMSDRIVTAYAAITANESKIEPKYAQASYERLYASSYKNLAVIITDLAYLAKRLGLGTKEVVAILEELKGGKNEQ